MLIPPVFLGAFVGIIFTMSFSGDIAQPDWSLALLLAVLLSKQNTWVWILPCIALHDLFLYWSLMIVLPYFLLVTGVLFYTDKRIGPGQPQRWVCLLLTTAPLLLVGMDLLSIVLTLTLSVWLWSFLSSQQERVYVEPA